MMFLRGLLLISLAVASCPSEGQASTLELTKDVNGALNWKTNDVDHPSRLATAKALLAYWQSFSSRVPRLSPAELAVAQQRTECRLRAGNSRYKRERIRALESGQPC
jgi:hypothetical protein